jgi:hypothetical protein
VHSSQKVIFKKLSSESCPDTEAVDFDGKIFDTLNHETYGESSQRNIIKKQDHFAVTDACREEYVGEFVVSRGTGSNIADGVIQVLQAKNMNLDKIRAFGADTTAANTGKFIGALAMLEEKLDRSCHYFGCCLHLNELSLRPVITHHLGTSSGPNGLSGPVGLALKNLPGIISPNFKAISNPDFYHVPPEIV